MLGMVTWLLTSIAWHQTFPSIFGSGDFITVYYRAASALIHGQSVYSMKTEGDPTYLYTPILALLLRPMTRYSPEGSAKIWFVICLSCLLLAIFFHGKSAGLTLDNSAEIAVMLFVGFHFVPTQMDLGIGQVQMPMLALLCAAYWADRRGRLYVLATLIAAAALIKTWMLGVLLYLLLRRRPREFVWGCIVFAAGVVAAFSAVGWSEFRPFVAATLSATHSHWALSNMNMAIGEFARMHFANNIYVQPLVDSRIAFVAFVIGAYAVVIAGLALAFSRPKDAERNRPIGLGLVMLSILLILPLYEQLYCVLLLPVFWSFLTGRRGIVLAIFTLPIFWVYTHMFGSYAPFPAWQRHGIGSLVPSAFALGTVVLWLMSIFLVRSNAAKTQT
jgi:hypothetical protein